MWQGKTDRERDSERVAYSSSHRCNSDTPSINIAGRFTGNLILVSFFAVITLVQLAPVQLQFSLKEPTTSVVNYSGYAEGCVVRDSHLVKECVNVCV